MQRPHARCLPARTKPSGKSHETRFRELELAVFNFLMDLDVRDRQCRGRLLDAAGTFIADLRREVTHHAPGRIS